MYRLRCEHQTVENRTWLLYIHIYVYVYIHIYVYVYIYVAANTKKSHRYNSQNLAVISYISIYILYI
jgi:hypothetical protein